MSKGNIEALVRKIDQIPTLPVVARQIMSLLANEDVSLKKVAELIEKDPALAVKVLKVANSAFYGTLNKVSTIDHALVVLGMGEVKSILMGFSIYKFFPEEKNNGFDRTRFWQHSIICSQVAKYLARHFKVPRDDTLFLSGLIHDVGKIVFDQYFHEEFVQILDHVSSHNESFSKSEKEILGITHYQVAAKLLQRWHFYHHAPWHDKNYPAGSTILYLADLFTKSAGHTCLADEKKIEISDFTNSKVMDFVVQSGFELDHDSMEKMLTQIKEFIAMEAQNVMSFFRA
jgi:HD-like signal output (HDOD) protein